MTTNEAIDKLVKCVRTTAQREDGDDSCICGHPAELDEALAVMAAIRAQSAETPQTPQTWQPIETAPKDGTPILMRLEGFEWPDVGAWFDAGRNGHDYGWWQSHTMPVRPTHWQPLPAPPVLLEPAHATTERP